MRILHMANHVNESGNGIVNVMVDLACAQAALGCEVAVASGGGGYEALLARQGVRHYRLDQRRSPLALARAAIRFGRIADEFAPDFVHAHMVTGALLARFARGFRRFRLVTHVHNRFQRSSDWMKIGDAVIAVSRAVADDMARRGVEASRLRVVRNGTIGSPRTAGDDRLPLHGRAIVTVAGMYERKGIAELLDAFDRLAARHPDAVLHLVGDGPDRARFEERAAQSPYRDRIRFEGFRTDGGRWMRAADVFVLASHTDSFPLVLVEAREAGCAIVATAVDGIPEALDNGEAGVLVPPRDAAALAAAIDRLLSDEGWRQAHRSRAAQGLDYYRVGRMAEETIRIYEELRTPAPTIAARGRSERTL